MLFLLWGLLPLAVVAHKPIFVRDETSLSISAEPSSAYYIKRNSNVSVSITYNPGDAMYTVVYTMASFYAPPSSIQVDPQGNCDISSDKITGNSHIKDHQIGDIIYEPFGETELQVMAIIHPGVRSNVSQVCSYYISDSDGVSPFVIVVGTEEWASDIIMSFVIGLPIIIMQIAVWAERYVYGFFLLGATLIVWVITRDTPRWYMKLIAVVFLSSAVNRWSVSTTLQWGLLWSLIPLGFAVWIQYVTNPAWKITVLVAAIITPTKSWLDVGCLLVAYLYESRLFESRPYNLIT